MLILSHMTRSTIALIVLLALVPLALACDPGGGGAAAPDESKEPPVRYTVTVGDKTVSVIEGETVKVDGSFTNPQISVVGDPHRLFNYAGMSFKYPRSYTFEADLEDTDAPNWTLSGNDLKIMVFKLNDRVTPKEFAEGMMEQFGDGNSRITNPNSSITLGGQALTGTAIDITVTSYRMTTEIYQVPGKGKQTRLIVFQDGIDPATGGHTKEGLAGLAMLKESFKLTP